MKRDEKFVKDLKYLSNLLDGVVSKTYDKIEESREIRKLLNLPKTVHNKTRLANYLVDKKAASQL
tara:strand:+ start:71 stop:265 length:195 start_codon:yes stop_codon:yes gene_type:complete